MNYINDDDLEVCEFDQVRFIPVRPGGLSGECEITKTFPRERAVRVRSENPNWRWKPTYKSETKPIENTTLIACLG